jgi:hypothetical protein
MYCKAAGLSTAVLAISLAAVAPAAAELCRDRSGELITCDSTRELTAQSRPRITIRPRKNVPGLNAKRYCRSWLATENRPSGAVITPQMVCWWQ